MAIKQEQIKKLQNSSLIREELGISIRWRILTTKGGKARIVAYQDARDVQKALDYVCGPENWSNEAHNIAGKIYMSIGISTEDGWVFKSDVGTETAIEATKGEASDAFKRASIMWGIFRDVYDMDYIVLDYSDKNHSPVTPDGELLMTPDAIAAYCNGISKPMGHLRNIFKDLREQINADPVVLQALTTLKNFINECRK